MRSEDYNPRDASSSGSNPPSSFLIPPSSRLPMDTWTSCMRRGDFAAAWEVSDAAVRSRGGVPCWHWPRHFQYLWDGTPLAGQRVLIRCYHGLGDTIQFIRYAPLVKAVAAEVIVWAQPQLLPLLRTASGVDRLLPLHDGTPDVEYDVDVESMELPHIFRTTLETIPSRVPYLSVRPARRPAGEGLAVGLFWKGGDWDQRRSVPTPQLAPLVDVPGVAFHVLHREPDPEAPPTFRRMPGVDTVAGTARAVRALDLVITIDSMPAHLAGALGVPVWTLLQRDADWRWLEGREDSPWYPTMRLFRQERAGDWHPVVQRVARELADLSARAAHAPSREPAGRTG